MELEIPPHADPDGDFLAGSYSDQSPVSKFFRRVRGLSTDEINNTIIMFSLSLLWILLLIISLMHVFSADSKQIAGGSEGIYNNLGYPPITDIMFASSCSGDYTELELGYWPGTVEFCYDYHWLRTSFNRSECWNYYPDTKAQTYTKWKGQSICVKRVTKFTNSSTFCPSGYTKCYKGMCVQGNTCPITSVVIEDSPLENTETTGSTQLLDGRYLNYKREQSKQPIALFTLTQGEGTPCISTHEYPLQKNYKPVKEKGNGCKKYGTFPDYKVIDTDTSLNSFQSQVWSGALLDFPEFKKTISQQNAYLTYSTRIELRDTPQCKSMNLEGLVYASTHAKIAATTSIIILVIELVGLFTATVFLLVMRQNQRYSGSDQKLLTYIYAIFGAMGVLTVIASILLWQQETRVNSVKEDVYAITERDCFYESSINKIFHDLHTKFGSSARIFPLWVVQAVICGLALIIGLLVNSRR